MAELFEEVVALLESRSATRSLAAKYRIDSEQAAGTGAVLGVPIFLAAMSDWAVDRDRSDSLSKVLRSIETTGLQDPGAAIDGRRHEPVGSELTNMLLGQRRPAVASLIAEEAGVKRSSANSLLPPTAWAVMASLADRYGSRIDRQSLISILGREHQDLVDGGWGPWLEATGQSGPGPLIVDDSRSGFDPDEHQTPDPHLDVHHGDAPAEAHSTGDWFSPAEEAFDPVEAYPPPVGRGARRSKDGPASTTIVNRQGNRSPAPSPQRPQQPQHRLGPQHPPAVDGSGVDAFDSGEHRLGAFGTGAQTATGPDAAEHGSIDRYADKHGSERYGGDTHGSDTYGSDTYDSDRYGTGEYDTEPFDDEDLTPNRIPLIVGTLALFLLAVAGIYWILNQQADSGETNTDQPTETDGGSDDGDPEDSQDPEDSEDSQDTEDSANSDDSDGENDSSSENPGGSDGLATEVVALDIVMDDPLGRSTATGVAELRFDAQLGEICYNFTVEQLQSPFEGHIHVGPAGVKGGIVVDFGMLNHSDIGCKPVGATEVESILADLPGHYVELHDPAEAFTIRAQLSEALPDGAGTVVDRSNGLYDPEGGGALTRVESGRLVLTGAVADQATADRLLQEYEDATALGLEVVDELTVVEGSPRPSGLITIDDSGLFAIGSDQLSADRGTVITDLAAVLQARPDWRVTIVGHTDSTGSEVINLALSLRRAEAVRDELINNGVATEMLLVTGAGSTKPIADNDTAEGRALNRRIELTIDRG